MLGRTIDRRHAGSDIVITQRMSGDGAWAADIVSAGWQETH